MIKHGDLLEDKLAPWVEKWNLSENEPTELKSFRLKIVIAVNWMLWVREKDNSHQGSPSPVRNWATQQEVSSGQASEAWSVFIAVLCCSHDHLSSASHQLSGSIDFSQEWNTLWGSLAPIAPQMGSSSCRTSSGLPLILHYGELYNYFIIYHNVLE